MTEQKPQEYEGENELYNDWLSDKLYNDWLSDNREDLMSDFLENHLSDSQQQDYEKYLYEEFERWRADR